MFPSTVRYRSYRRIISLLPPSTQPQSTDVPPAAHTSLYLKTPMSHLISALVSTQLSLPYYAKAGDLLLVAELSAYRHRLFHCCLHRPMVNKFCCVSPFLCYFRITNYNKFVYIEYLQYSTKPLQSTVFPPGVQRGPVTPQPNVLARMSSR